MYVLSKRIGIKVVFLDREIPNLELEPVIPFHQLLLPYPKLQNLDNTSLTIHKYHTMVTCSGNSAGNSTDKQPQNKDSLTKGYKTESRKDAREIQRKKTCLNLYN